MKISRYLFLIVITMLTVLGCNRPTQTDSEYYLFVGTYTGERSDGIYLFRFDSDEGLLTPADTASGVSNPSYLNLSPDHSFLYAVNEEADSANATVSAFSFDKENGKISFLNKQTSRGGAPCYVSTDHNGKAVFVGNYLGGSLAMFPINEDGSLADAQTIIEHVGSGVNKSRQEAPHVHCTIISPDNKYLFVTDLGTDQINGYPFNSENTELEQQPAIIFETKPGAGPRHLTFHPNRKYAYLVTELSGTVYALEYDGESLKELQTISALPDNYAGTVSGADIHVSPDGKFLYVSNREDLNDIAIYSIDEETGMLTKAGRHSSDGVHPRNFMIDPTGNFLLVANRYTNNIVVFHRDKETGMITPTGHEVGVSQPVSLQMIPVD